MSFRNLLKKKYFYVNVLLAVVVLIAIIFIVLLWMKNYTRHNENIEIPDFIGKQMDSLIEYAETNNMRYVIMDSIFDDEKPKGSIVLQNPQPYAHIKTGRTIYVSIVAQAPEMSVVPNLINLSVRQGINILKSNDLKVEKIEFIEGFDRNSIQQVLFKGKNIAEGEKVLKNSALTIIASKGDRQQYKLVPNIIGITEEEAINIIHSNSFNVGKIERDQITNNAQYFVYYQTPAKNSAQLLGTPINLKLTIQKSEIEKLHEETLLIDSTLSNNYEDSILNNDLDFQDE
ncbi:MAG: PASTA domain-containing protein [Bacteroidales bacterium]|nr:PASTA domain-containing protein [Bacteroidales bacterium]